MYDPDRIKERFFSEVDRLIHDKIVGSLYQIELSCGVAKGRIWGLRTGRTKELTTDILARFVQTYRAYGVSYEYILEGKTPDAFYKEFTNHMFARLSNTLHAAIDKTVEEEREAWQQHLK